MRTHTSDFKNGLKQYGKQFSDTLYYSANGSTTSYGQDDINRFDYSVDAQLLKSVMQTIKVDSNISFNLDNKLQYDISLDGVNNSTIHFKNFNIIKKEEQKDKKSYLYTCQDNMIKAMQDYVSFYSATLDVTFVDGKNYYQLVDGKYVRYTGDRTGNPFNLGLKQSAFPMTIRTYISNICTALRLTFKNASDTFTNYNKQVTEEHYVDIDNNSMGYTFRDVLDDLAEATGNFICIDDNGQLEVRGFTTTNDTIDEEYFDEKNVTIGKKVGPYNVVVLSRGDDSDNLYYPSTLPASPYELKIVDNPILEQDNREDFIQGIYNNINGLEFYLNDVTTKGILYYEVGDKYNISIGGVIYPCLMLRDNIKRTTGLKEIITTTEPKLSVTDYKYASSSDKVEIQSRNAYIKANKAEGTAEMIVQGIGSNGQVTGASVIASINNDSSNLKLEADKIDLNGVVTANNNFKIKTDGSVEINNGIIELNDTTSSGGVSKIKITGTYNNDTSLMELYSNALLMNTQYNGYLIVRNIGDEGIFLVKVADDNSYRTENFLLHNQIQMTSNNNTTFEVDGTTGNTTIKGTLYGNDSSRFGKDVSRILDNTYVGTGVNLNNIKQAGQYGLYGNNTNSPTSDICVLEVAEYSPDWLVQTLTSIQNGKKWSRRWYSGNTWSSWIVATDDYSTSEQIIGKWLNDKPIYRKVITFTTQQGINNVGSISNIEDLVALYGEFTDGSNKMPSSFVLGSNVLNVWISGTDVYCQCEGYVGYTGNITFEYTKTTD